MIAIDTGNVKMDSGDERMNSRLKLLACRTGVDTGFWNGGGTGSVNQ